MSFCLPSESSEWEKELDVLLLLILRSAFRESERRSETRVGEFFTVSSFIFPVCAKHSRSTPLALLLHFCRFAYFYTVSTVYVAQNVGQITFLKIKTYWNVKTFTFDNGTKNKITLTTPFSNFRCEATHWVKILWRCMYNEMKL